MASLRQKLDWVKHPLSELRIVSDGKKIAVHIAGQKMEAISGQILFDFDAAELGGVKNFPERKAPPTVSRIGDMVPEGARPGGDRRAGGRRHRGVSEGAGAEPRAPPAHWSISARFSTGSGNSARPRSTTASAIAADPGYPLAQFNLGNLYDEQGRTNEAFEHYRRALHLNPNYADAHFNLALLCERTGDTLKAVHHWKLYLKLDSSGQWAEIARRQLDRIRQATVIK